MRAPRGHTGRPDIQPWLRGWVEDKPQASIIWRKHLPARVAKSEIDAFFEAAPPHTSEMLEAETWRIADWLIGRVVRTLENASAADAGTSPIGQSPALLLLGRKN